MKIYSNPELIKRNQNIGFWSALLGPIMLAIGASFGINSSNLGLSMILLVLGFIFYQIGQALRRYGSNADKEFNEALKSLNDDYALYHFIAPTAHLLIGPAGVWILIPRHGKGTVTYNEERKRWRLEQKGLSRLFGGNLTRPDLEMLSEGDRIDRYLQKHWQQETAPHLEAAVVLLGTGTKVDAANAPVPTMHISKLRGFIKTQEKKAEIDQTVLDGLTALFTPEEEVEELTK